MTDVYFEELREEQLEEVLRIYNEYVSHTTATFHTKPLSAEEMRALVFFEDPKYRCYLIKAEGETAGYVILTRHKTRQAYDATAEISIYLKPGYTGRGIGRKAVGFIEALARQQGMHVLIAAICGENTGSIKLFEACGYDQCAHYRQVGVKFGTYLDVVDYQKILTNE